MIIILLPLAAILITAALLLGLGFGFIQLGAVPTIVISVIIILWVCIAGAALAFKFPGIPSGNNGWIVALIGTFSFILVVTGGTLVGMKLLGHYVWAFDKLYLPAVEQPIDFPHTSHVQKGQIDCVFCHSTVDSEPMASVPPVEQCMFCHKVIGKDLPGVQKVLTAWDENSPIKWIRVHRLPDHVRFVHEAHISYFTEKDSVPASAVCTLCHGEVGTMKQVEQVKELKMGFCVECHRNNGAPTDCTTCHY